MIDPSTDAGVDYRRMMSGIYRRGAWIAYTGTRGGGKTHHCIGNSEFMVEHEGAVLLTNVIFNRFKGWKEVPRGDDFIKRPDFEGHVYPPGVEHVTTLEQVFRLTGELLENDPDQLILLGLDEVQNFILADLGSDELLLTFYRYGANTRKFGHCVQTLTPSLNNLPPRLRTFNDDPRAKGGGYLDAHIYKSRYEVDEYNRAWGTHHGTKEMSLLKISFDHRAELLESPITPWAKPWKYLKPGDVIYDHLASAIFRMGDFSFEDLILKIGDTPSQDVPMAIMGYFDHQDAEGPEEDGEDSDLVLVRKVVRGRQRGIKWDDLAFMLDTPRTTLQSMVKRFPEYEAMLEEASA